MTTIRLYNTATRRKETFSPLDPANVRIYVCGPTVYDRAHLGNARPVVVFDVLYRLMRHVYGAEHVTYVRNFTDVDDKINAEALRRRDAGVPGSLEDLIRQRTEETIGWYHADMDALGALRPDHEPRATAFIGPMVAMIETLIARGHAYVADGHVLFDVRSYAEYGRLSGRSPDDMIAGARVEVAPFKRDPLDFVLWKPSDTETPGWASPWGRGRPGWHIECSAMARDLLGGAFDIHGGGIDLAFPHHENEIAQSRCAHPDEGFAKVWMHNEMLQVEGRKMSKSLGNFFTVRDLLDQGKDGTVLRLVLLRTHYSSPIDFSSAAYSEMEEKLHKWFRSINALVGAPRHLRNWVAPDRLMMDCFADDLNTWGAIVRLDQLEKLARRGDTNAAMTLDASLAWLGIEEHVTFDQREMGIFSRASLRRGTPEVSLAIDGLIAKRADARRMKQYAESDRIRDGLEAAGIRVVDGVDGPEWEVLPDFDPSKLMGLE